MILRDWQISMTSTDQWYRMNRWMLSTHTASYYHSLRGTCTVSECLFQNGYEIYMQYINIAPHTYAPTSPMPTTPYTLHTQTHTAHSDATKSLSTLFKMSTLHEVLSQISEVLSCYRRILATTEGVDRQSAI